MPFFSYLEDQAVVGDIVTKNRRLYRHLSKVTSDIMSVRSPLSRGDREMIAAYVSGLNQCQFCFGGHSVAAQAFGLSEDFFDSLLSDLDTAPVNEKMRSLLRYIRKLTLTPEKLTQADYDDVIAVGWDEQALEDAIAVVCLFKFWNAMADGHGLEPPSQEYRQQLAKTVYNVGYRPMRANIFALLRKLKLR